MDLAQRETALEQEIAQAQRNAQFRDGRWSDAKARQEQAGAEADPALAAEVEAQRRWTAVRRREVELLNRQRERLAQQRDVWQRRFQIANDLADRDAMLAWRREAERALEDLEIERRLASSELASARADSANLATRGDSAASPQTARWLGEHKRAVDALVAALDQEIVSVDLTSRRHARLVSDVSVRTRGFDALDTLESIWQGATRVWNYEITVVDDRSITPGKIVIGLLLIVGGLWVSRRATRMLGRRLMPRLGVDGGAAAAIQTLIFYALVITFTLFALRIVQSDLRHRIASLFREAGVTIAFPQRDLHMDTLKPLDVRLLRDSPAGEAADTAADKPPKTAAPPRPTDARKP